MYLVVYNYYRQLKEKETNKRRSEAEEKISKPCLAHDNETFENSSPTSAKRFFYCLNSQFLINIPTINCTKNINSALPPTNEAAWF
jgi:hypothetical protein